MIWPSLILRIHALSLLRCHKVWERTLTHFKIMTQEAYFQFCWQLIDLRQYLGNPKWLWNCIANVNNAVKRLIWDWVNHLEKWQMTTDSNSVPLRIINQSKNPIGNAGKAQRNFQFMVVVLKNGRWWRIRAWWLVGNLKLLKSQVTKGNKGVTKNYSRFESAIIAISHCPLI